MAEAARPTRRSRMPLPMTGMIDCVFQLLIFFMLMPSYAAVEGYLTTNLPTDPGPRDLARAAARYRVRPHRTP